MLQCFHIEIDSKIEIMNTMKKYLLCFGLLTTLSVCARVSTDRIKGWLELDEIQRNINTMMDKYKAIDVQLKHDANEILEQGIAGAQEIADSDPYAALVMYHKVKTLKDVTVRNSLDIAAVNKRFQELSDYVDQQYKELREIRLKHLRFPF